MPKQVITIVNASTLLTDDQVWAVVPALQIQYDRDFKPPWGDRVPDVQFEFAGMADIPTLSPDCWPMFLNRHSSDAGALGWHTDENKVFGRVFAGDCLRYGIDWAVDLGHEVLETALDPTARKVYQMPNGMLAAFEACDAVEDDKQSYDITTPDGTVVKCSNFVLPDYFDNRAGASQFDYCGKLTGPCPSLTPGGYMSLLPTGATAWTTIQQDHQDGIPSARFLQSHRHRRAMRQSTSMRDLIII